MGGYIPHSRETGQERSRRFFGESFPLFAGSEIPATSAGGPSSSGVMKADSMTACEYTSVRTSRIASFCSFSSIFWRIVSWTSASELRPADFR